MMDQFITKIFQLKCFNVVKIVMIVMKINV